MNKKTTLITISIFAIIIVLAIGLRYGIKIKLQNDFCGKSTFDTCSDDSNCKIIGSGASCQGTDNNQPATTEWKNCYQYEGITECKCIDKKCQWDK